MPSRIDERVNLLARIGGRSGLLACRAKVLRINRRYFIDQVACIDRLAEQAAHLVFRKLLIDRVIHGLRFVRVGDLIHAVAEGEAHRIFLGSLYHALGGGRLPGGRGELVDTLRGGRTVVEI